MRYKTTNEAVYSPGDIKALLIKEADMDPEKGIFNIIYHENRHITVVQTVQTIHSEDEEDPEAHLCSNGCGKPVAVMGDVCRVVGCVTQDSKDTDPQ